MDKDLSQETQRIAFGHRVRRLRSDRKWTLEDLSERSGLAISTISKAERGVIALTYDRLSQLARGLGCDMSAFFSDSGEGFAAGSFAVARKGEFKRQETENYVYEMLFTDLWHKSMRPMMGTLKARELHQFDEFVQHGGQEFLIVLEGEVTVHLQGRDPVRLGQGDSVYFDSMIGHLYASGGDRDARILVVCENVDPGPRDVPSHRD
ncbi:XRE family transcriptional regulator [Aestuariivita sp.]|jgi:transcriptional regulator with XRE-family HTH domain|uniref:helix-turn-helix domain-containing protein n=1 Tax=Aestuariivita sp. TaxID=1872407 RepID=UPI0021742CE2|nr:XRE family transcriptional regulator [Aestuariivita sp.]MCE8008994.1 helix-turn-helix domain-containing protein [Aestuariivita sp.]